MFLVAVVTTVVPMITPRTLLDAALRGVAPELIQSAGRLHIIFASLLVPAVPAVQVTVALLFFGYAKFRRGPDAPEVIRLTLPVCAAVFISAVDAIDGHVASLMRWYTVRLVEAVLAARDLAELTIGRRTRLHFIAVVVAVSTVIAYQNRLYTFAIVAPEHVIPAAIARSDGHDVGDAEEDGERRRGDERTPGGPSHHGYPGEIPGTSGSAFTTGWADAWPHSHRTPLSLRPSLLFPFVSSASLYPSLSFVRALSKRERERGRERRATRGTHFARKIYMYI